MEINITTNFDLSKFDTDRLVEIGIHNSLQKLQNMARENAPYVTGNLRKGIAVEEGKGKGRV